MERLDLICVRRNHRITVEAMTLVKALHERSIGKEVSSENSTQKKSVIGTLNKVINIESKALLN